MPSVFQLWGPAYRRPLSAMVSWPLGVLAVLCAAAVTRDWSGEYHGWGLDRFSIAAQPGVYEVHVRVARRDGSSGPESFVKFRVDPGTATTEKK